MVEKENIDFMEDVSGQGYENIGSRDIATPFLKILQALSPELEEGNEAFISGAKIGMFFNSLTGQLYGREIKVIPLHYEKSWLEWRPRATGGGLVNKHAPFSIKVDQSDFSKWKYGDNEISETLMFYCLIDGHQEEGPIVYALSSSGIKHGKNWNTNIMMTKLPSGARAPFFSSVWILTSVKQTNAKGTYYQIGGKKSNIKRERFITAKEFSDFVLPIRDNLKELEQGLDYKALEGAVEEVVVSPTDEDDGDVPY